MKVELELARLSYEQSPILWLAAGLGVNEFFAHKFSQLVYLWGSIVLGVNTDDLPVEQFFLIHVLPKPSPEDLWSYSILAVFGLILDVFSMAVGCSGLALMSNEFSLSIFLLVFYSFSLLETLIYFLARVSNEQDAENQECNGNGPATVPVHDKFNVQLLNAVAFLEIYSMHHEKPAYYDALDKEQVCVRNIMVSSEGGKKRWSLPALSGSSTLLIRKGILHNVDLDEVLEFIYKRYNDPATWLQNLKYRCTKYEVPAHKIGENPTTSISFTGPCGFCVRHCEHSLSSPLDDEYEERISYVSHNKPLIKRIFNELLTWESSLDIRRSAVALLLCICENKEAASVVSQAAKSDDRRLQALQNALPPSPDNELNRLLQKLNLSENDLQQGETLDLKNKVTETKQKYMI
ncbi:hypothetical protein SELMODRAFT_430089 [Selaginella moellendorffii]|uniref:Uncharacterized protein n=1 Tax=Selaginella moellendorffii TaxID=88036 RepID=D8T8A6_SELML|nr:hypothetical protein SELMODRAFT_430089 [Selaginella moellendorffii]